MAKKTGRNNKQKIKIRLKLEYVFLDEDTPNKNTFTVFVDGKKRFKKTHADSTGHRPLQTIVETTKGHHKIEVQYAELNAKGVYSANLKNDIGLEVCPKLSQGIEPSIVNSKKNKLFFNKFPFKKIFYIR